MKRVVSVLAALLFAVAGCGSGDDSGGSASAVDESEGPFTAEETTAVRRIEAQFADSEYAATGTPEEASCMAKGMVGALGIEKLQRYGILTSGLDLAAEPQSLLSAADAETWADVDLSCVDYETHVKLLVDAWNDPPLSSAKMSECVDAVTEQDIHELISGFWQDRPRDHTFEKLRAAGCGEFAGG